MVQGLQPTIPMRPIAKFLVCCSLLHQATGPVPLTHGAELITGTRGYVGGMLGLPSVNEGIGTGLGFGFNGAYFLPQRPNWGLGAFFRGADHRQGVTAFFYGVEGLYRFADVLPGLLVGVVLGSGKFTLDGVPGNRAFTYGFKAAYDYPISRTPVTVGVDASVNWLKPGNTVLNVFNPMITIRYWFE